jgi:hypothetical protein
VNLYYTSWKDRYNRYTGLSVPINPNLQATGTNLYNRPYANLTGIHEVHMGIEFEGTVKATSYLSFNAMFLLVIGNIKEMQKSLR